MATKAELQAQIDKYNEQINSLKETNNGLAASRDGYISYADNVINGFNKDYNFGGRNDCWGADPLASASSYVNAGAKAPTDYCSSGHGCSQDGCISRIKTINENLQAAIDRNVSIKTNSNEIDRLMGLITGLNTQINQLPEVQQQLQTALVTAAASADEKKKKMLIFGVIALVIVIAGVIIVLRITRQG